MKYHGGFSASIVAHLNVGFMIPVSVRVNHLHGKVGFTLWDFYFWSFDSRGRVEIVLKLSIYNANMIDVSVACF